MAMPMFIFPDPMPCLGHVSGKCRGMGKWRRRSQGHRGEQPSLASNPALSNYGRWLQRTLTGCRELFLMVVNMANPGGGLACYCSFSEKVESGLFWAGDKTSDPEAGQSRPGPWGKASVCPCHWVRLWPDPRQLSGLCSPSL